ncbi:hypothetical protein [Cellulosimicrobium sp. Marseille-Q8652]
MHDDVTRRRPFYAAVAAAVLLGLGLGVAAGLGDVLAVEATPSVAAPEQAVAAPAAAAAAAPGITTVVVPDDSLRLSLAADAVVDALAARGAAATVRVDPAPPDPAEPDPAPGERAWSPAPTSAPTTRRRTGWW